MNENLICEVGKNATEKIRVKLEEYRNSRFVDCRVYFQDESGKWLPTKKGITLNKATISEVIEALQKAREALGVEEEEDDD